MPKGAMQKRQLISWKDISIGFFDILYNTTLSGLIIMTIKYISDSKTGSFVPKITQKCKDWYITPYKY